MRVFGLVCILIVFILVFSISAVSILPLEISCRDCNYCEDYCLYEASGLYSADCAECTFAFRGCSDECGAECETDADCLSDGWYCDGDIKEYRDYSCNTDCTSCVCEYSPSSRENCNNRDGWYNKSLPHACCRGEGERCASCQDQEYRDYICSVDDCTYSVTNTRTVKSGCSSCGIDGWYEYNIDLGPGCTEMNDTAAEYRDYFCDDRPDEYDCEYSITQTKDCNPQDGWYGGGNNPGCGPDPSSEQRDYYVNSSIECAYTTENCDTKNCDSSDVCSNLCDGAVIKSFKDYYVVVNTNTCTFAWGPLVEDCSTKASTDSDGQASCDTKLAHINAGTVRDYTGCSGGSCTYQDHQDSCSGDILTEYCASGSSYASGVKNCGDYDACSGTCPGCTYHDYYCSDSNPDYCAFSNQDPDAQQSYCIGCGQYWDIGGDVSNCCGDDDSEYRRTCQDNGVGACAESTDDEACCDDANECVYNNACYPDMEVTPNGAWMCRMGIWEPVGVIVEVMPNPPSVTTVWQSTDASASVNCTTPSPFTQCDPNSYRLLTQSGNLVTCPTDYNLYSPPGTQSISSHSWVCGAAKDTLGNEGFSSPVEFLVDKIKPIALLESLPEWTNESSVIVGWGGSDTGGSGVNYFELQYKTTWINESRMDIAVSTGFDGLNTIKIFESDGSSIESFTAFGSGNTNGEVHLAAGDLNGDGIDEIIAGHGYGGSSWVKIFKYDGSLLNQFNAFGAGNLGGEVYLAVGNFDSDPGLEIAVSTGFDGLNMVKIFESGGGFVRQFNAFDSSGNPNGEVYLASGDVNGDGKDEIIAGHGEGGSSQVRVFDESGNELGSFVAFDSGNGQGEVNLASGDVNGDGKDEIIAGHGEGGSSQVRVFDENGNELGGFVAFGSGNPSGEVHLAAGDVNKDGKAEMFAGHGYGGSSWVKIFKYDGSLLNQFNAFGAGNSGGEVYLAVGNFDPGLDKEWMDWISPSNPGSDTFTDMENNRTYHFRVRARDNAGNIGDWSPVESISVDMVEPTCEIGDLPMYTTSAIFIVNWSGQDGESGIQHYDVQAMAESEGCGMPTSWDYLNGLDDTTETSYERAYQDGCKYFFRCRATDLADNGGDWSAVKNTTVDATPPISYVENLTRWMNSTSFMVNWTGWDGTSGIECYDIQWSNYSLWSEWFTCTQITSSVFGPDSPAVVEENVTYSFRSRARDGAGNSEGWPLQADAKTTIDLTPPEFILGAYDQDGNPIMGQVSAAIVNKVVLNLTSTDSISGVNHSYIEYKITDEGGETLNSKDCGPADPYGGVSECGVTIDFTDGMSIEFWARVIDRAGNVNMSDSFHIGTHPLANFVKHNLYLSMGESTLAKVQVRNIQKEYDNVTVTLSSDMPSPPHFVGIEENWTWLEDSQTLRVDYLNPHEERVYYVRVWSAEPYTYQMSLHAYSALNVTDSDQAIVQIGYPASFPGLNEWAIFLLIILAVSGYAWVEKKY